MGSFLLGILAGVLVSVPIGPFGLWAISVYIRDGWGSALAVAFGGMFGDICVLLLYLGLGQLLATLFSINLEHATQDFFNDGLVRGFALCAVGIFLVVAVSLEHTPSSKLTKFWASFAGAVNPLNAPAIGFILSKTGIEHVSMQGWEHFIPIVGGFFSEDSRRGSDACGYSHICIFCDSCGPSKSSADDMSEQSSR